MGTLSAQGEIDPSRGVVLMCLGKKRSGKSKMGLLWFMSYPGDRLVIDINGTDGPKPNGKDIVELKGHVGDLPSKWPEDLRPEEGKSMTLYYHPDLGSPTFLEDVDAVLGMAYNKGDVCVIVHEMGIVAPAGKCPPHVKRMLQSNRHRRITLIMCAPRAKTMEPLTYGQADMIYVFELPNKHDRDTISDAIGWDNTDFALAVEELGAHEYLRADTNENRPEGDAPDMRLVHCPPLPADVVAELDRLCA